MIKIIVFLLLIFFVEPLACNNDRSKMSGYNIRLWYDTPAEELARAVKDGDTIKINKILKEGKISVDYPDPKYGETLLTWAILLTRNEMVQFLLEKGANPNFVDFSGESPIIAECENSDDDTFRLKALLDHGADPNFLNRELVKLEEKDTLICAGFSPITFAAYRSLTKTKMLIKAGADPNLCLRVNPGRNALQKAISMGKKEIVKYLLLEGGGDPDKTFFITLEGNTLDFDSFAEDRIVYTKEDEMQIKEWAKQARLRIKNKTKDTPVVKHNKSNDKK